MRRTLLALALLALPALAANPVAPNKGQTFYQDMSSTNVPATFGAGSQLVSGLTNSQGFEICTSQTTPLAGCSYGTSANCAGCTANFIVPASGCVSFKMGEIFIGPRICVKGLPPATAVSSGSVYGAVR